MILPIYLYGQPVLRRATEDIDAAYPNLKELISNMYETLEQAEGCGLAAPQIGLSIRLFIVDGTELAEDYPECAGFKQAFINPEIIECSGEQTGEEGCLSVPGKSGVVTRPNYVKARAYDENMELFEIEGTELFARAMCHEFDHLDGHLYVEKVEGELKDVAYEEGE